VLSGGESRGLRDDASDVLRVRLDVLRRLVLSCGFGLLR
jgi:hypothetical protein